MAEPFKTFINADGVQAAAGHLARTSADFDAARFCADVVPQLDALELKARAMCIATALEEHLATNFDEAAAHLERALAPHGAPDQGLTGWFLWAAGEFVARRGLEHPVRSLACLQHMTQRFTAEFAIRPFIVAHPRLVFDTLQQWIHHPSEHVRRLVSEGTRPRLPWGLQLKALIADPSPSLPLLTALLDDDSEYVRRSVANHLNDIAKDHPELVAEWVERYLPDASAPRRALLRHASRTLIKQGHRRVMHAWGTGATFAGTAAITLTPARIVLGEHIGISVTLQSHASQDQVLTIDYIVHHVKADGTTSPKVFKGWHLTLSAGQTHTVTRRHAVKPITTRRYYPGRHLVTIQVNGHPVADASFVLQCIDG
ncbi:DNA alkylation repair protein [Gemmatimonas phototrophica]|uniref:DNA alkylation repair protein n=1 Tax=Gemmatimonas phototrophica TaxID=1379270 RepID=A0A143BHH5_9BACT|nr:DNA alkylation repair protein [Gemmatimonas phototrophica]AMW04479.1 DNA alkylation repair protein [Gemmatimonas phototrophica]